MKNKIILFAFSILIVCYSCAQSEHVAKVGNDNESVYKIKRIKNKKEYHLIYAERNDSIFKIITDREDLPNCNKIKVGMRYALHLGKSFPIDSLFGQKVMPNLGIKGMGYKGDIIMGEKKSHNSIYYAKNLKGLCIQE